MASGTRKASSSQQKTVQIKKPSIPQPGKGASMSDWGKFFSEQVKSINENLESLAESSNFSCAQSTDSLGKLNTLSKTVQSISDKMSLLSRENSQLRNENQLLQERLIKLECHSRRQNVVFEGIPEQNDETTKACKDKVMEKINAIPNVPESIKISRCHRVGPLRKDQTRAIKCYVESFDDKVKLFRACRKKLEEGVAIHDDFPPEVEERRKILKPILKAALLLDDYKNNSYLNVDRLMINNVSYTYAPVNNLHMLPDELNPRVLCERSDEDVHVFFGIGSPMSNFHPCEFVIDGTKYSCNEQYIQSQKASLFSDDIAQSRIMNASSPYKMKAIGSRIRNFEQSKWLGKAKQVAKKGALHKFQQNRSLANCLVETGRKQLAEASKEIPWGNGFQLKDDEALDPGKWKATGIMGEVLTEVRGVLLKKK